MSGRSWLYATSDLLLAAAGLAVVCYPAISTGYALVTGGPADGQIPMLATAVVAVGGAYPFVAGDWSYRSLFRFAVLLVVYFLCGTLVVASLLAGRIVVPVEASVPVRAGVLAVAYPLVTFVLANAADWEPLA